MNQKDFQLSKYEKEIELSQSQNTQLELELFHSKNLVKKLAFCLKSERTKNSTNFEEELSKLRFEYLQKEEQFLVDGNRFVVFD